ncbi:MAG: hypothetical protein AMJ61_02555 [Desulfobacterales bacterium SG8_35_2]|nr:MAG: hypothetical protein AMJ61_02555 [Desulfobacterales bacterium SG8_35_2]
MELISLPDTGRISSVLQSNTVPCPLSFSGSCEACCQEDTFYQKNHIVVEVLQISSALCFSL